jgi:hypothetical protein
MESAMALHEVINQDFLDSIHKSGDTSNVKPLSDTVEDIITAKTP